MRDIVVEGPDNTGKSTFIKELHARLPHRQIVPSEGPEKYHDEINPRIARYCNNFSGRGTIFDRHPAVSEHLYCFMRDAPGPTQASLDLFYDTDPLFIYCRPAEGRDLMTDHVPNHEVDTAEHLRLVENNYAHLWHQYDEWALQHAHFVRRIGDDTNIILNATVGALSL